MTATTASEADGRLGNIAAAVLLGGASSRMGSDKAQLEFEGMALASRTSELCQQICHEVLLVGGSPPPGAVGRVVEDVPGPRCALRGIVSALSAATADRVLVVATDMPLLTADLLLALVAWPEYDVVAPRTGDRRHPLCALYRREAVLELARERLEAGQLRLHALLDAVETGYLEGADLAEIDAEGLALCNVNTPQELAAAARHGAR